MTNQNTHLNYPSYTNGYCWSILFQEPRATLMRAFYDSHISFKQFLQMLNDHHDHLELLGYFKILKRSSGLIHIIKTNKPTDLNINQTINSILTYNTYLEENFTFTFLIIGAMNIDKAREHLTSSMHQEVHQTILLSRLDTIEKKN